MIEGYQIGHQFRRLGRHEGRKVATERVTDQYDLPLIRRWPESASGCEYETKIAHPFSHQLLQVLGPATVPGRWRIPGNLVLHAEHQIPSGRDGSREETVLAVGNAETMAEQHKAWVP